MQHAPFIGQGGYEVKPSTLKEGHDVAVRKTDSEVVFVRHGGELTVWAGAVERSDGRGHRRPRNVGRRPVDRPYGRHEQRIRLPIDHTDEGRYDDFFQSLLRSNEGSGSTVRVVHGGRPGHADETVYEF